MTVRLAYTLLVAVFLFSGCKGSKQVDAKKYKADYIVEIEIAPEKFLLLECRGGRAWFRFTWNGTVCHWLGVNDRKFGDLELPKSLREFEGNLYLIVTNREDLNRHYYRYLKLDVETANFTEIDPKDFPREVAVQNMSLSPRHVMTMDCRLDRWELVKKLDCKNLYFLGSETCKLWLHLEGYSYDELESLGDAGDIEMQRLLCEYIETYQPIPVQTIERNRGRLPADYQQ